MVLLRFKQEQAHESAYQLQASGFNFGSGQFNLILEMLSEKNTCKN